MALTRGDFDDLVEGLGHHDVIGPGQEEVLAASMQTAGREPELSG
jgi:hypothetical protein